MFKKLRIKFIAITMAMVAVVMALAFGAVCISEQQRSLSVVQTTLSDAVQNIASSPMLNRFDGDSSSNPYSESTEYSSSIPPEGGFRPPTEGLVFREDGMGNAARPEIGGREGQPRNSNSLVPVAVYLVDQDGTMSLVPEVTNATISSDLLVEASELALETPDGFGTYSEFGLHYSKQTRDDGSTILAFADTSYTDGWKSLALALVVTGMGVLAVFFVISLFFSKWALKPMREAWDSQRQFVADASHDLKTPLTVILANASILLRHPDSTIASESQWIESTQVEAENMQGLVNEMLELAQIENSQRTPIAMEELDFSDLVEGETLLFDSVALERSCAFECEVQPGVLVSGNPQRLQKMISTIFENAFKYVDEGGCVAVDLAASGKTAKLVVTNTGSEISAEDLPHIFDRFYRTDKARTSGAGGFGLGLAIAREIARAHQGDITCQSGSGKTAFTITLPVR